MENYDPDYSERYEAFKEAYYEQKKLLKTTKSLSELNQKERKALIKQLAKKYEMLAGSKMKYIVGFIYEKQIFMVTLPAGKMSKYMTLDQASRGAGKALRFTPTLDMKKELIKLSTATPLNISVDAMMEAVKNGIEDEINKNKKVSKNKGHWFEKIITNLYGQPWERDNIPFYLQGDLMVNDLQYQIKFEGATFSNEQSLTKILLQQKFNVGDFRK